MLCSDTDPYSWLKLAEIWVLLLQVSDEFLFVVQLIPQAADLLLMSFTVGVDLLLHRFLNTYK